MTDNEIVIREADQSIMKALPSEKTRRAAMYIMASDLGIPADFVDNPETSLMATTAIMQALNLRIVYGAIPGVHVHAVKRRSKVTDANGRDKWVDSYQIQDGEKLYKDSMSRHAREGGFMWAFSDTRMSQEELTADIRARGYEGEIPANAVGIWSAVKTSNHVALGVNPMPVAGVWFGKVKQGSKWFDDHLPSGTNPVDVAMRRAHKRAIMASEYPLRPLGDEAPDVRAHEFVGEMLSRVEDHDRSTALFVENGNDDLMLDVGEWEEIEDEKEPAENKPEVEMITAYQRRSIHAVGNELYPDNWDDKRHELVDHFSQHGTKSLTELNKFEAQEMLEALRTRKNELAAEVQA